MTDSQSEKENLRGMKMGCLDLAVRTIQLSNTKREDPTDKVLETAKKFAEFANKES